MLFRSYRYQYLTLTFGTNDWARLDRNNLVAINITGSTVSGSLVRRLTRLSTTTNSVDAVLRLNGSSEFTPSAVAASATSYVVFAVKDYSVNATNGTIGALGMREFLEGEGGGASSFTSTTLTGQNTTIPEIDIKVDSIAVTAQTKKLKAKWSPELGQDLNAYHNLDAEVELTSILSEHVALEIDQEILNDLVKGATAAVKYWSRRPGKIGRAHV